MKSAASRNTRLATPVVFVLACVVILLTAFITPVAGGSDDGTSPLRLCEVMTSGGALPDWVEIENLSGEAVNLTGWALITEAKPSRAFVFPGGSLEPGGRVVVFCDDGDRLLVDGEYHAPFKLSAAGVTLELLDCHGAWVDRVTTPKLDDGQVYCRDGQGEWTVSDAATPGAANQVADIADADVRAPEIVPGPVEITEVMTRNATYLSGEHCDYIELHNTANRAVNLEGWYLSDSPEKRFKWCFPEVSIPADGYLTVHCDGGGNGEALSAGFKLSGSGEEVFLTDPEGNTVGYVSAPALNVDQAWSLTGMGWTGAQAPTPGAANDQIGIDAAADAITGANGYGVYVTELLASASEGGDWIELYNASAQAVDLSGFGLSDNAGHPRKWQFPGGTVIQPGGFLLVYADAGENAADGMLHADFRLSAEGGYSVTLCDPQGGIFDRLYVPAQYRDVAYGRPDSFRGVRYFAQPTPGAANSAAASLGRAPMPVYSTPGGLFATGDTVTVEMRVPAGCSIYYTLDCTDPTRSSTPYAGPITITGTTILRTRVYAEGYMESVMDTQSYLFDVNNGGGTIYVASLVSDPYNLFSDEAGIMAMGPNAEPEAPYGSLGHGANFWMNWEREAHIEVFHPNASNLISQECGVRLHGNSSRAQDQKAFKILARSAYGDNRFRASLFTRRPYTEYQAFLLRTGAQDIKKTHMRDEVLQSLAADYDLMYQEYEAAVLYLNGEFWGHYSLRELVNTFSICQFEGWEGDEDALDLVNKDRVIVQGSDDTLNSLLSWLQKNDCNTDEAYQAMDSAVDLENYLKYIALEMYIGNYDSQNIKCYRNPNGDGKWRWILYDLDCGFDLDTNSVRRWLDPKGMGRNNETDNRLFLACMKNDRTRDWFLTFLGQEMATTYSTESLLGRIEAYRSLVAPILKDQLDRWGMSEETYNSEVEKLREYARTRPMRMLQFLKGAENLHLTREEMERYFGGVMAQVGVVYDDIKAE